MTPSPRELSIGQRFQLGILCADYDHSIPLDSNERSALIADAARIARYLTEQGIGWERFSEADQDDYPAAYLIAALVAADMDSADRFRHDLLRAANRLSAANVTSAPPTI